MVKFYIQMTVHEQRPVGLEVHGTSWGQQEVGRAWITEGLHTMGDLARGATRPSFERPDSQQGWAISPKSEDLECVEMALTTFLSFYLSMLLIGQSSFPLPTSPCMAELTL